MRSRRVRPAKPSAPGKSDNRVVEGDLPEALRLQPRWRLDSREDDRIQVVLGDSGVDLGLRDGGARLSLDADEMTIEVRTEEREVPGRVGRSEEGQPRVGWQDVLGFR